ncbi:hypothetical protein CALCODRAFT_302341 [Calocera cornea HHB12733]|uniref:Uncharacterized protein n=1 Tax=Calocera cornea HHB12733 TaxID=1353952 RepID=A0A165FIV9_9BASI|nr:hypothetical protein CALCODRAFT_302341 [Calocera cornea HHB12733]
MIDKRITSFAGGLMIHHWLGKERLSNGLTQLKAAYMRSNRLDSTSPKAIYHWKWIEDAMAMGGPTPSLAKYVLHGQSEALQEYPPDEASWLIVISPWDPSALLSCLSSVHLAEQVRASGVASLCRDARWRGQARHCSWRHCVRPRDRTRST